MDDNTSDAVPHKFGETLRCDFIECPCMTNNIYWTHIFYMHSGANITWSSSLRKVHVKPFRAISGPCTIIPSVVREIFMLFFTTSVLDYIVVQSNNYAQKCLGDSYTTWQPITTDELQAYMGFMILMGLVKLPSIYDYWKKDEIFHYSPVASRISRNRFFDIHRYLHFVNNDTLAAPGSATYDKLGKIRPLINMITSHFASVYKPGRDVSIDEAMVPFKGRSSLKQYMPKKPVKRGLKVWMQADAKNGYVSDLEVYTGRKGDTVEKGLGSSVVKTLTSGLQHTYRHIYFDNFFTSIDLLVDLFKIGLYGCGTLRTNRTGFPQSLKLVAKKGFKERGKSITYQHHNLTVSVWQDNKPVIVAATNVDPTESTMVDRKQKDGTLSSYPCPLSVSIYNKYMGGVDNNDQLRGYYHVRLKCRKYYKYIFWFLFDLAITNSFILCKQHTDLRVDSLKAFRADLAKQLIADYCSRKRLGRPALTRPIKRFCQAHFPTKASNRGHRCHYCYSYRHERHETVWYCNDCQLYLCHTGRSNDCFLIYHTQYGPELCD